MNSVDGLSYSIPGQQQCHTCIGIQNNVCTACILTIFRGDCELFVKREAVIIIMSVCNGQLLSIYNLRAGTNKGGFKLDHYTSTLMYALCF